MSVEFNAVAHKIAQTYETIGAGKEASKVADGAGKFENLLEGLLTDTDDMQKSADTAVDQLLSGKTENVQEVMMAVAKADVSFRMMLQVRNRLLEAYQEVMRMQV